MKGKYLQFLPNRTPSVGEPGGHHESVVHEVAVDSVQGRVFGNVHLNQVPVVQEIPGGHVGHVTAAFHAFQKVIELSPALVKLASLSEMIKPTL